MESAEVTICSGHGPVVIWQGKERQMLRISQLKLPVTHTEEDFEEKRLCTH